MDVVTYNKTRKLENSLTDTIKGNLYIPSTVVLGYLDSNGDLIEQTSGNRVTFNQYVKIAFPCEIHIENGYGITYCFYNDNYVLTKRANVFSPSHVFVPANTNFRVSIMSNPETAVTDIIERSKKCHIVGTLPNATVQLTSADDLNNISETGVYAPASTPFPSHWPVHADGIQTYGIMQCIESGYGSIYQIVHDSQRRTFLRMRSSAGTWTNWLENAYQFDVTTIKNKISEIQNGYVYLDSTIVSGLLNTQGEIEASTKRAVFDEYLMLGTDSVIRFDTGYAGTVCLYDNNKVLTVRTNVGNGKHTRIPADTFFRVSIRNDPEVDLDNPKNLAKNCRLENANAYEAAAVKPLSAKIFKRVGCIGDSYTEGYINAGGEVQHRNDYAWPHYMETLTGNTWTNFGVGGSSCKSWIDGGTYSKLDVVQASGNKCQAYVIGLGINDSNPNAHAYVPVGTSDDIGQTANSYYSYYYRLVQVVHAVNEDAPIFCNTCPKSSSQYLPYNQAVRDIVAYCKTNGLPVYLCDLAGEYFTEKYYKNDVFSTDAINGHYTGIGYEMMAECYVRVLSDVINANVSDFQTVHLIDYDELT